jgi:DNA-binding transcriptional LysR family regulator
MSVDQEIKQGLLREIRVKELTLERKIRLVYPGRRALSHAAKAFLDVVKRASVPPPEVVPDKAPAAKVAQETGA